MKCSHTLLASLLILGPVVARTVIRPMPFSEIVKKSERIFVGTVQKQFCRYENDGQTIRTYVVFHQVSAQKGAADATITLRFEGGSIGENTLRIPGMPRFQTGKRYLCYVRENGKNFSAITGFHQGVFELATRNRKQVLLTQSGHELVGVKDDRFVLAPKPAVKKKTSQLKLIARQGAFRPAKANASELEERAAAARKRTVRATPVPLAKPKPASPAKPGKVIAGVPVQTKQTFGPISLADSSKKAKKQPRVAPPILLDRSEDKGVRMGLRAILTTTTQTR